MKSLGTTYVAWSLGWPAPPGCVSAVVWAGGLHEDSEREVEESQQLPAWKQQQQPLQNKSFRSRLPSYTEESVCRAERVSLCQQTQKQTDRAGLNGQNPRLFLLPPSFFFFFLLLQRRAEYIITHFLFLYSKCTYKNTEECVFERDSLLHVRLTHRYFKTGNISYITTQRYSQ